MGLMDFGVKSEWARIKGSGLRFNGSGLKGFRFGVSQPAPWGLGFGAYVLPSLESGCNPTLQEFLDKPYVNNP